MITLMQLAAASMQGSGSEQDPNNSKQEEPQENNVEQHKNPPEVEESLHSESGKPAESEASSISGDTSESQQVPQVNGHAIIPNEANENNQSEGGEDTAAEGESTTPEEQIAEPDTAQDNNPLEDRASEEDGDSEVNENKNNTEDIADKEEDEGVKVEEDIGSSVDDLSNNVLESSVDGEVISALTKDTTNVADDVLSGQDCVDSNLSDVDDNHSEDAEVKKEIKEKEEQEDSIGSDSDKTVSEIVVSDKESSVDQIPSDTGNISDSTGVIQEELFIPETIQVQNTQQPIIESSVDLHLHAQSESSVYSEADDSARDGVKDKLEEEENSVSNTLDGKAGIELSFTSDGGEQGTISELNTLQSELIRDKISEEVQNLLNDSGDVKTDDNTSDKNVSVDESRDLTPTMPEKRDDGGEEQQEGSVESGSQGKTSPDLTKAFCRYRWAKTVPTQSDYVMFFCTVKMEEPVKLTWTESSECFYSDEREVPCGVYQGNLVVDGRTYPIEDLTIKHYTFEVDIYVSDGFKEDVIDDEYESLKDAPNKDFDLRSESPRRSVDSNIHVTGKYEDLVRQQLTHTRTMETVDTEVLNSQNGHKSPFDGTQNIIGDEENTSPIQYSNSFLDGDLEKVDSSQLKSPARQTPVEGIYGSEGRGSPLRSLNGSGAHTPISPRRSAEPSVNGSGVNTPIADVIGDVMLEQRSPVSSHHSSARHTPQAVDTYDDALRQDRQTPPSRSPSRSPVRSPMRSRENSGHASPQVQDFVGDVLGQSTPVSGSARQTPSKQVTSAHSSNRQTPTQIDDILGTQQDNLGSGSYHGSLNASPRQTGSYHGSLNGSPAPGSYRGSPTAGSYHGSYHGSSAPGSHHSSVHGSPAPGSHHSSVHGSSAPGSHHSSVHGSPAPGSYHGSVGGGSYRGSPSPGSQEGGSGGSRPVSLTSEQELSQYFEHTSRGSAASESHRTPVSQPPYISPALSGDRITGTSSLPLLSTQQRHSADISKRSMTPDNHIRLPGSPGPKGSPVASLTGHGSGSRVSSRASNRTITPTSAANGYHLNGLEDSQSKRVQELEDDIMSQRQVLTNRELEVHELTAKLNELRDQNQDLRDELADLSGNNQSLRSELTDLQEINQSLKSEIDHVRSRQSPGINRASFDELDRKYKQVQNEKDILAQEVVKLRDKLEEMEKGRQSSMADTKGLNSYDPNNPYILQRKIEDLQSQVQDLQEANESAVTELSTVEKRCQDLEAENDKLRTARNMNLADLQAENRRLHDKVSLLWDQRSGEGDRKLWTELQQLKDDNHALKERNYKLHEENLLYMEEAKKFRKTPSRDELSYQNVERLSMSERLAVPPKDKLVSKEEITKSYQLGLERSDSAHYKSRRHDQSDEKFRSTLDRDMFSRTDRLKSSIDGKDERYQQLNYNEKLGKDEKYSRSALEKEERIRSMIRERRDDIYSPNIEKEERFRSSFDKDQRSGGSAIYKSSRDQDDMKHRYEQSDRSKHDMHYRSNSERGSVELYDRETKERSRTFDKFRSRPDSGSDLERASYHRQGDRSKSESLNRERDLKDSYQMEDQDLGRNREYKSLNNSYSELLRVTQRSSLADHREWSRSDLDVRTLRARSRTPEPRRSGSTSSHTRSMSPPPPSQLHHNRASRHLPLPQNLTPRHIRRSWDDEHPHHRRSTSNLSDRSDSTSLLTSAYLKSQHSAPPLPPGPGYRSKEIYDDRVTEKIDYDTLRKLPPPPYPDDRDNDSDTATDILVNAHPFEKDSPSSPRNARADLHRRHHSSQYRRRRDSLESESDSSPEDVDEQMNMSSSRKRSKSADGRELLRRTFSASARRSAPAPVRSTERPSFSKTAPAGAGFRSVTPGAIPTQHNKTLLSASTSNKVDKGPDTSTPKKSSKSKSLSMSARTLEEKLAAAEPALFLDQDYLNLLKSAFGLYHPDKTDKNSSLVSLTSGLRPFAPRSPGDINLEDIVKFSRQGGKLSQGTVKYVGHLPGRSDVYLGVELDKEDGKHDGTFEGNRYFKCKPNKGVFVAFNKVVMAWAP